METEDLVIRLIEAQMGINKFLDYLDYKEVDGWGDELKVDFVEWILDLLEVPRDNTITMEEKFGDSWSEMNETFCRDRFTELLYESNRKPKEVYNKLLEMKKEVK